MGSWRGNQVFIPLPPAAVPGASPRWIESIAIESPRLLPDSTPIDPEPRNSWRISALGKRIIAAGVVECGEALE
jgi:hypothetical protein